MGIIRLIVAPIRSIVRSWLFQFAAVLAIILLLDYYSFDYAPLREISGGVKTLVDATVRFFSEHFRIGILTDPVLQVGLIIAYVYVVCLVIAFFVRIAIGWVVDFVGWSNFLWLQKHDRPRARHCRVPCVAAAGAHQAGAYSAGKMGRSVCLAGGQFAALPAAGAADPARGRHLRGRPRRCRHSAATFYAVPGPDLARQMDRTIAELSPVLAKQRPAKQKKTPAFAPGFRHASTMGILAKDARPVRAGTEFGQSRTARAGAAPC